jgi:hypothetical protein
VAPRTAEIGTILERRRRFGDELYGLEALLGAVDEADWQRRLEMIGEQELHHILEGLGLSQKDIRDFVFDGEHVLNPYTNESMVVTCDHAVTVTEDGPEILHQLMLGDRAAEATANRLMKQGNEGDGFWRVLPYAHELDDEAALAIGMWPAPLRSYLHLYRKVSDRHLEVSVITLDQSNLAAHGGLLGSYGASVESRTQSYELARITVPVSALHTEEDRDAYLEELKAAYSAHHPDGYEQTAPRAETFIAQHQLAVNQVQELYGALAESIIAGQLNSESWQAIEDTFELCQQLGLPEQWDLAALIRHQSIDVVRDETALRMLINVRRYGIWQYLSQLIDGDAVAHELTLADIRMYARRAAYGAGIMPGCPGGFGLEAMFSSIWGESNWHGGIIRDGVCAGCNKSTQVGKQSWCRSCITMHCAV